MKASANGGAKTGAKRQSNAEKGKGSTTPAARTEVDQHNVGGGAEGARKGAKEGNGVLRSAPSLHAR
jgi:hypothetical protein